MEQFKRSQVVMLPTKEKSTFGLIMEVNKLHLYTNGENPNDISDNLAYNQHLYITSDDEIKEGNWKYNEKLNCITQHCRESKEIYDKLKIAATWCKKIISTTDKSIYLNEAESNGSSIRIKFPQPSDRFIQSYVESYNKGNVITDVNVSYDILYDIELLTDISKDFKKGSHIRGKCETTNDFSKFKKWWLETYTDGNALSIARELRKTKQFYKDTFKEITVEKPKVDSKDNTISIHRIKNTYTEEEVRNLIYLAWATASAYGDKTDEADCKDWIKHNLK